MSELSKEELNKKQKEAVEYLNGPLYVFAGPGTGKTKVTTHKLAYLIREKGYKPEEVLALTFANKAAGEMEERARELLPGIPGVKISTFHSFCNSVVQENALELGVNADGPVFTEEHQQAYFLEHLEELGLEHFPVTSSQVELAVTLENTISRFKQENITVARLEEYVKKKSKELKDNAPSDYGPKVKGKRRTPEQKEHDEALEQLAKIKDITAAYRAYEAFKTKKGLMDFGDMQMMALRLFEEKPAILGRYQEKFKYIIVDEFQDTDFIQLRIIFSLAPNGNVTVVGDDDQSIYRFRGAYLTNLQEFKEHYTKEGHKPETVTLELNYRCTGNIQGAASALIKHNADRAEKKLRTEKDDGEPVTLTTYKTDEDQAVGFLRKIEALKKKGSNWEDIAILVRRRVDAIPLITVLEKAGIPFEIIGSKSFFEEPVIIASVAYLKALDDPSRYQPALAQIMSRPIHGITPGEIQKLGRYARNRKLSLWDALGALGDFQGDKVHLERFRQEMERLFALKGQKGFMELLRALLFGKDFFQAEVIAGDRNNIRLLNRLYRLAREYREIYPDAGLTEFLGYVKLLSELGLGDETAEPAKGKVHFMTIHGAKGMQFPQVFIPCLSQDRIPSKFQPYKVDIPPELADGIPPKGEPEELQLQEERRLLYVGITRGMGKVRLGHCKRYGDRKTDSQPSIFADEIGPAMERKVVSDDLEGPQEVSRTVEEALHGHVLASITRGEWQEAIDAVTALGRHRKADVSGLKVDKGQDLDALVEKLNVRKMEPATEHTKRAEYSPTRLDTYEECPKKYWFSHVLEIPGEEKHYFELGTCVHNVLEEIAKRIMAGKKVSYKDALELLDGFWNASAYESKAKEKEDRVAAEEWLKLFLERQAATPTATCPNCLWRIRKASISPASPTSRLCPSLIWAPLRRPPPPSCFVLLLLFPPAAIRCRLTPVPCRSRAASASSGKRDSRSSHSAPPRSSASGSYSPPHTRASRAQRCASSLRCAIKSFAPASSSTLTPRRPRTSTALEHPSTSVQNSLSKTMPRRCSRIRRNAVASSRGLR